MGFRAVRFHLSNRNLTVIATIIAIVVGVIQIRSWLFEPTIELRAHVKFGQTRIPPAVVERYANLLRFGDESKFQELMRRAVQNDELANAAITVVQRWVQTNFPKDMDSLASNMPLGYWHVTVTHSGTRAAEAVALTLPNTVLAEVTQPSGDKQIITPVNARATDEGVYSRQHLNLGTLHPSSQISIFAWTRSVPFDGMIDDDILLTHTTGFGEVTRAEPETNSVETPFYAWVILVLLALGSLAGAISLGIQLSDRFKNKPLST